MSIIMCERLIVMVCAAASLHDQLLEIIMIGERVSGCLAQGHTWCLPLLAAVIILILIPLLLKLKISFATPEIHCKLR